MFLYKASSRDVFKTCFQHILRTSSAKQFFFFQDAMSWKRLKDVLKTKKCLLGVYYKERFKKMITIRCKSSKNTTWLKVLKQFICNDKDIYITGVYNSSKNSAINGTGFTNQVLPMKQVLLLEIMNTFLLNEYDQHLLKYILPK